MISIDIPRRAFGAIRLESLKKGILAPMCHHLTAPGPSLKSLRLSTVALRPRRASLDVQSRTPCALNGVRLGLPGLARFGSPRGENCRLGRR